MCKRKHLSILGEKGVSIAVFPQYFSTSFEPRKWKWMKMQSQFTDLTQCEIWPCLMKHKAGILARTEVQILNRLYFLNAWLLENVSSHRYAVEKGLELKWCYCLCLVWNYNTAFLLHIRHNRIAQANPNTIWRIIVLNWAGLSWVALTSTLFGRCKCVSANP